jgi:enoyl-CoA hydratase/carnithine racemase
VIEREYAMIRVAAANGVATVTLHNPPRKNAIGPVMVNELLHALADAADDAAVRVIVLTGAGDAFCAGGDFGQMSGSTSGLRSAEPSSAPSPGGATGANALPPKGDYADLLLAMTRSPKPILARVNGPAMGGGLGLVAASHFAVAVRGAKLGTPEINVGLFPMMIMAVLARVVPRRRLLEMMLFGERMEADQAAAIGLVSRAVDAAELDAEVKKIADTICSKSPITVRLGLEAFAAQDDLDLEKALPMLRERLAGCLATDDAREGLMAFLEKRQPKWTGK